MLTMNKCPVASTGASSCPMSTSDASSSPEMNSQTLYSIVVEKGKSPDTDGFIVSTTISDSGLLGFRQSIAKRSPGTLFLPEAIQLEDTNGKPIESVEHLANCNVAFLVTSIVPRLAPLVPGYPLVGVMHKVMGNYRDALDDMHSTYGDTIRFYMLSQNVYSTRDPAVARVIMNDSEYFYKRAEQLPFAELQELGGKGLFTTTASDPAWKFAHRLLMPAFSASSMKVYGTQILTVAEDASNWVSTHLDKPLFMPDFTANLTFETIGLVAFGYDFHLLDPTQTEKHPFLFAMDFCLKEITKRSERTAYWKMLPTPGYYEFKKQMKAMRDVVQEVIDERRASPDAKNMKKDILGYMLNARAPDDDGKLVGFSDSSIFDQIITLGIAGSETSSITMAWVFYMLDRHQHIQQRVLQELADAGIKPHQPITVKQAGSLKYLTQVIDEVLRMFPPVPILDKYCAQDIVVPGGYQVKQGQVFTINVWSMHRNPKVFPNPHHFDPDRFSDENSKSIPYGAYLPFSSGDRACIGFQLAMIEMRTLLARLLSNYEFRCNMDEEVTCSPDGINVKPYNLVMDVSKRTNFPEPGATAANPEPTSTPATVARFGKTRAPVVVSPDELPRLSVMFGSNMGVSEEYATQMLEKLGQMGYTDATLQSLDDWDISSAKAAGDGKRTLAIIITSTYNGVPPDNACKFAKSLDTASNGDLLKDMDYVVFGCGNSLWRTFQKFPRHIFERLQHLGATPLCDFQSGDSNEDMDEDFLQWSLRTCALITEHYGSSPDGFVSAVAASTSLPFEISFVDSSAAAPFRLAEENASIKVNQELQDVSKSRRSTRHIEIKLDTSSGISYQTGDHLNVYPANRPGVVREVAAILNVDASSVFKLKQGSGASRFSRSAAAAIQDSMCSVTSALQYVCDWKEAPSRELVVALGAISGNDAAYDSLRKAADDVNTLGKQSPGWNAFVAENRTVLEVLRRYAPLASQIPLVSILHYVSAMTPRRYSIASCQQVVGNEVHLSVAVVDDTANGRSYRGLATEYLASLEPGDRISVAHRPAQAAFHLPSSPDTPVMFIGAGTGIAPFRGFLQEMKHASPRKATMYFGCRSPEYDYLYKDELDEYVKCGTLSWLQPAFSRVENECKYVQHHISADGDAVCSHLRNGGYIYVCGSADRLAKGVVQTILATLQKCVGLTVEDASAYLSELVSSGRYVEDVW